MKIVGCDLHSPYQTIAMLDESEWTARDREVAGGQDLPPPTLARKVRLRTWGTRQPNFDSPGVYDLLLEVLEPTRRCFALRVYGHVVMPEHVHWLVSEPEHGLLADAVHHLKLSFAKRLGAGVFWQKRYYDRNLRHEHELQEKLRCLHRHPVKRGLCARPQDWKWTSFRHYALWETAVVEIESEWTARDRERQAHGGGERIFLYPGSRRCWTLTWGRNSGTDGSDPN